MMAVFRNIRTVQMTGLFKFHRCIFHARTYVKTRFGLTIGYGFSCIFTALLLAGCRGNRPADASSKDTSPITESHLSVSKMVVQEGFEVKLVAAEPLVSAPVALDFDREGRIWVVEMNGYMPDTTGTGEEVPNGKIVILADTDRDGVMDERKVFLDSLVMPRALCLVEDGLLVAEPPNLWFYEIEQDKPGKRTLVDGEYATGGNAEHQPNGLLRALDNWIYNAKSDKRYRKEGSRWRIGQTQFRGQWGIAQDDQGRLFYNTNSDNILGDYFPPGLAGYNPYQGRVSGYNEKIVHDRRVYPARPTPGVNRGYQEGILDDKKRLVSFTAACGPLVYRGGLWGSGDNCSAFVCEPAANLVKHNLLYDSLGTVKGKAAYEGREFLASTDERFRPVSLHNGPDGAMYIVDMYRGILEHITYMTPYLKNEIGRRQLTLPLNCGRIYKVFPTKSRLQPVRLADDPEALVELLGHPNGWARDKAGQTLVDRKYMQAVPALREAIRQAGDPRRATHALWALEGLEALTADDVTFLLEQRDEAVRRQALSVIPSVIDKANYPVFISALEKMLAEHDGPSARYIGFLLGDIRLYSPEAADRLLKEVVGRYPDDRFFADAVISKLDSVEEFRSRLAALLPDSALAIRRQMEKAAARRREVKFTRDPAALRKKFPRGAERYAAACEPCHGRDGNGVKPLAPPLNRSEWVGGNENKLIAIVLFGLKGPVVVNGHLYRAPEIQGDMPGLAHNRDFSDEDIAQLLSFIRKSWQNNAKEIAAPAVGNIRQQWKGRREAFDVEELQKM